MLAPEDFMTIQALVKRGVYLCDIAEQLGVPLGTVKSRIRLACQRIRQSLGDLQ